MRELLLQVLAHLEVFGERRPVMLLVGEPLRAPVAIDGEAKAGWMNLLSHGVSLFSVADDDADVATLLADHVAAALRARGEAAQRIGLVDVDRRHLELVDVGAVVVLGVGDRRLEHLLHDPRTLLRAEREHVQRAVHRHAADHVGDEPAFLRRQAYASQRGNGFHSGPHLRLVTVGAATFLSEECPLNVRVSANSPSLWPTMFSDTYTGMCCLPLCTAMVRPTNSGVIVERRDHVLIGFLSFTARAASTFFNRWSSTNGPFLIERAIQL